jgi:hypothetical protein
MNQRANFAACPVHCPARSLLRRLFPGMHARYIHVLRIDPDRLDAVRLDQLWKSLGDDEAEELQGGLLCVRFLCLQLQKRAKRRRVWPWCEGRFSCKHMLPRFAARQQIVQHPLV